MRSILFAALFVPTMTLAQETLEPGARIRVIKTSTNESGRVGVVVSAAGDSALVRLSQPGEVNGTFALSQLEVARGQRTRWGEGALIGAGTGAVVGFAVGWTAADDCRTYNGFICFDRREIAPAMALVTAGAGAIVGGLIGRYKKTERWVRLAPPR